MKYILVMWYISTLNKNNKNCKINIYINFAIFIILI